MQHINTKIAQNIFSAATMVHVERNLSLCRNLLCIEISLRNYCNTAKLAKELTKKMLLSYGVKYYNTADKMDYRLLLLNLKEN
jgi:hypothetical protein